MCDLIVFIPVGTSIVTNQNQNVSLNEFRSNNNNDKKRLIQTIVTQVKSTSISNTLPKCGERKRPDSNPAEISSLYAFWLKEKSSLQKKTVKLVLIHSSDEGNACANGVKELIENSTYFPANTTTWKMTLNELADLDPKSAEKFPGAMEALADIINSEIKGFNGEVYLNITGGYKALAPYMTMMGMALGRRVKVFYLFEESAEIIYLPVYPMAFDLLEWRDWRGLLLPFRYDIRLTDIQKAQLRVGLEPSKVSALIKKESPYSFTVIGQLISDLYWEQKSRDISEFGQGALLLNRFDSNVYANYLAEHCIPLWRHLSVGDHIPETVEHGRGHVQRLLELAQQLLIAANIKFQKKDEALFVLISSIWLHDLGHSGDHFTFEGKNGLLQNPNDSVSTAIFPVYGDPEAVRKYHNFLTYQLLKTEGGFLFPERDNQCWLKDSNLLRSVELACLYHRRNMPVAKAVNSSYQYNNTVVVSKGIQDFDDSEVISDFPLVASLLRFVDGVENQEERTGSLEYYQVAQWVLQRQTEFMKGQLEYFQNESRLRKETIFKERQKAHFNKHRWVRHIFLVAVEKNELNNQCKIYGKNDDKLPIVGAYIITNPDANEYGLKEVKKEIAKSIVDEFILVKDILPFRLAVIIIELDEETGKTTMIYFDGIVS